MYLRVNFKFKKMKSTYTLSIPEPCHENWQSMNVSEKGKFCNACQKNVHDFTKASDKQIIDAFKIDKNLCGRFLDSQLQRDIFETKEKSQLWLATSSIVLSLLTLGNYKVSAQEKEKIEQNNVKNIQNFEKCDSIINQRAIAVPINPKFRILTRISDTNEHSTAINLGNTKLKKRTFFGSLFIRIKIFILCGY